jgi:cobaltochelatase CobN
MSRPEQTKRELVEVYRDIAVKHDVHTSNETFKAYVAELAQGFGLGNTAPSSRVPQPKAASANASTAQAEARPPVADVVRGQELREIKKQTHVEELIWSYLWLIALVIGGGIAYQAWRARQQHAILNTTSSN